MAKGHRSATLTVAEDAAYARAAERMHHVWARGSGMNRYPY